MGNKRLLIISDAQDLMTERVSSWIKKLSIGNVLITRINYQDPVFIEELNLTYANDAIVVNQQQIDLKQFDFIWYRRGGLNFEAPYIYNPNIKLFKGYLMAELTYVHRYFFTVFGKNKLSNYYDEDISKLTMLDLAVKCGLKIPKTKITSSKKHLVNFYVECNKKIITKALQSGGMYVDALNLGGAGTTLVSEKMLTQLQDNFFPSLFQQMLNKDYEIRTFYLGGTFRSMAIFSQLNKKTKIDFRNYDMEHSNRTVPYRLPIELEKKLKRLLKLLDFKTGSVDFVKGKDGEYYFLEVNPVGQFAQVSIPCNYQLEKKVATYILRKMTHEQRIKKNT